MRRLPDRSRAPSYSRRIDLQVLSTILIHDCWLSLRLAVPRHASLRLGHMRDHHHDILTYLSVRIIKFIEEDDALLARLLSQEVVQKCFLPRANIVIWTSRQALTLPDLSTIDVHCVHGRQSAHLHDQFCFSVPRWVSESQLE